MQPNQSPAPNLNPWQQPPYPPQTPQQPAVPTGQMPSGTRHYLPSQGQAPSPYPPQPMQPQQYRQSPSEQLANVVSGSQEVLCTAKSVFPFVMFPDTIIVDREKVTITHTSFFKSGDTESTHIDDILNVTANLGPMFGSLKFTIRNIPPTNPHEIKYVRRKEVIAIKNILQGYIIARQNNIDTGSMPRDELVDMLQRLGGGRYRPAS